MMILLGCFFLPPPHLGSCLELFGARHGTWNWESESLPFDDPLLARASSKELLEAREEAAAAPSVPAWLAGIPNYCAGKPSSFSQQQPFFLPSLVINREGETHFTSCA